MSTVLTILRKNHPQTVLCQPVAALEITKLPHRFMALQLPSTELVYVKCDQFGQPELRGKKQEYRLYAVATHPLLSVAS